MKITFVAGILNSLGGFLILAGAFVQARHLWREHKFGRPTKYESETGHLRFWPSFRSLSFAGEYGWTLIFLGGGLVLVGSIIATIAAA
jgi:hypothetical protein